MNRVREEQEEESPRPLHRTMGLERKADRDWSEDE
jgi:hypothetical protein